MIIKLIKNWAIIDHDGSVMFITTEEADACFKLEQGGKVVFTSNREKPIIIHYGSIKKLLPIEDYYQQYPGKRSVQTTEFEKEYVRPPERTKRQRIKAMESMRQGMMDCVNRDYGGVATIKIKEFLNNADKRIEYVKSLPVDSSGNSYNDILNINKIKK